MSWRRLRTSAACARCARRSAIRSRSPSSSRCRSPRCSCSASSSRPRSPTWRSACTTPTAARRAAAWSPSWRRTRRSTLRPYATRARHRPRAGRRGGQRRAGHPARLRPRARRGGTPDEPPRSPGPLRRRRDRARRQRRGLPARAAGGGGARLARGARRPRPRATADRCHVVPAPLQSHARRQAVHGRRHVRLRAVLPDHAHHRRLDRQRAPDRHLRAAAGDARHRLEILLGKLLPLGGVFAVDVVLMVLVAGVLGVWPAGSSSSSSRCPPSTCWCRWRWAIIFGDLGDRRRGGAEDRAVQHPAGAAQRLRLSGPQHAAGGQWIAEIFPATHYIRVSRAIYLRGAGPTEVVSELALLGLFGVLLMAYALRSIEARHDRGWDQRYGVQSRTCSAMRHDTSGRTSCAVAYKEASVLRHDKPCSARAGAADHDAAAVRLRAVQQARERAVGGARPEPDGAVAALRRGDPDERLLPAAARRRQLRGGPRTAEADGPSRSWSCRRDFRRDTERGGRGSSSCSTAPTR